MDRSRQSLVVIIVVVLCVVGVLGATMLTRSTNPPSVVASPAAYIVPWWVNATGVDTPITASELATLNNASKSDVASSFYPAITTLAKAGAIAQLSGVGRSTYGGYFAGQGAALCTQVHVRAVAPVMLPVAQTGETNTTNWAKILVAYTGACQGAGVGANSVQVLFLYEHLSLNWQLVHEYQIPGSQNSDPATNDSPAPWQMTHFSSCTHARGQEDLIVVVEAYDLMCSAAAKQGIALEVTDGWRSAAQQAVLFNEAVKVYGSVTKAKQYVAYATSTTCTSLHCAGVAVDVVNSPALLKWLYQVVGCITANGTVEIGPTSCASSAARVLRMERYGFEAPAAQVPEYLVYVLPTSSSVQNCNPASSSPVAVMVAQIWRCVLSENRIPSATVRQVVAQAEVVSLCESSWNALALAYGGKYATSPDPATGRLVTNAGVFMLSSADMTRYGVQGASATDPVANISAAAQLWSASHSFEAFGCATGHGGFGNGPVLPQYGGSPVPAWAYSY